MSKFGSGSLFVASYHREKSRDDVRKSSSGGKLLKERKFKQSATSRKYEAYKKEVVVVRKDCAVIFGGKQS